MKSEYTLERGHFGRRLVLTSAWNSGYADFMQRENVRELYVNDARGWVGDNLKFLNSVPFLEAFGVLDLKIKDVTPVHNLPLLRALEVSTYCITPLDFSCWPKLEDCTLYWRAGAESLFSSKLISCLFLHRYGGVTSEPFGALSELRDLSIANSALREVHALGLLQKLQKLGLYNLKNLESLSGLERLHQLQKLAVSGCKRIGNIDAVATLTELQSLELNDSGSIASLEPLRPLSHLARFAFAESTNIKDGQLGVLLDLPNLAMTTLQNRKHYSHRREEIAEVLSNRNKQRQTQ